MSLVPALAKALAATQASGKGKPAPKRKPQAPIAKAAVAAASSLFGAPAPRKPAPAHKPQGGGPFAKAVAAAVDSGAKAKALQKLPPLARAAASTAAADFAKPGSRFGGLENLPVAEQRRRIGLMFPSGRQSGLDQLLGGPNSATSARNAALRAFDENKLGATAQLRKLSPDPSRIGKAIQSGHAELNTKFEGGAAGGKVLSGAVAVARGAARLAAEHPKAAASAAAVGGSAAVGGDITSNKSFGGRFVNDAVNLPAQAAVSLFDVGAGVVEAAGGDSKRLGRVVKGVKATDPLYALLTGHPNEALKRVNAHPGFALAEAAGVKGGLARGAGRAARGSRRAAGKSAPVRAPATVPGTNLAVPRDYPLDVVNAATQKALDRSGSKRAARLRAQAKQLDSTDSGRALELRQKANRVDPLIATDKQIAKRYDRLQGAGENRRRQAVGADDKVVSDILKSAGYRGENLPGDKGAALSLVAQNITRASVDDLRKRQAALAAVYPTLKGPSKRAANVEFRKAISESIATHGKKDPQLRKVLAAAQRYSKEIDQPVDKALVDEGLLNKARGDKAKLMGYAAVEMGAERAPAHIAADGTKVPARVVDSQGAALSAEAILTHMKGNREVAASYVSQAPNAVRPGAYFRASNREPTISAAARTEKPTLEGTFNVRPEALRASALNRRGLVVAAQNFRRDVSHGALRDEKGAVKTMTSMEANRLAAELHHSTGHEFVPVAVKPFGARREQLDAMARSMEADANPGHSEEFRTALDDALAGKGDGPFALVPRAAASQMRQHLRVLGVGDAGKAARSLKSSFTQSVLATSPGPTFGNLVEPVVRSAVAHAGPLSHLTAKRFMARLREVDPEAAKTLESMAGHGKITLASRARYTDPKQFNEGSMRTLVAGYQAVKRAPVARQGVAMWRMWTDLVFKQINGRAEVYFRGGPMLGKLLRDSELLGPGLLRLSNEAMDHAIGKVRDENKMAQLADGLDEMYGKYDGFSPALRKTIAELTPFAAWFLSSVTFVTKVLPRDHPSLVALTATAERANEEWRKSKGMDLFMGKNALPGWLQGTLDVGGGNRLKLAYSTPLGAFTDPLGGVAGLAIPQAASVLKAFQGQDWKGKPLRNPDGTPYTVSQLAAYAGGEFFKSTVPAVAIQDRAQKYVTDPGALLNPVRTRAKPKGGGPAKGLLASPTAGAGGAEARALQAEAEAIAAQQSTAGGAEQRALQAEARASQAQAAAEARALQAEGRALQAQAAAELRAQGGR